MGFATLLGFRARTALALLYALVWLGLATPLHPLLPRSQSDGSPPPGRAAEAQQSGPNFPGASGESQSFALRTQTNLVLVDVRVWDRAGRPVTDLRQDDFKVFEDGVLQSLTSFSLEKIEQLQTLSSPSEPPPTVDLGKLPPQTPPGSVIQNHRLIVLFFDLTSMAVDDLMRALKASAEFVHSRMVAADLVAVATYTSSLRVLQDFTNDRGALARALEGIRVGESSSLSQAGSQGEAGSTNASGQQVTSEDISAAFTPDETEFNIFNTDEKLAAIESLARMLRDIPGRKSVIHFSSGIERTGVENQAQLRSASDAANRSNVSLYSVDARGLAALPPGGDASSPSPAGLAIYSGQAVRSQVSTRQGSRETLATLSADTGGRTFYDLNDFGQVFQQVEALNSTYYMLGYSPSNKRSDGRFRRLRVVIRRPGVKVEARPGYFAPKDFRQFTRQDKELQIEQAMDLDAPFVELPLVVEPAYFRQPDGRFYVVLAAKIPGSGISFLKKSAVRQTEFDFASRATDNSNRTVATLRDTLFVKLTAEAYEQVLRGNILYEGGFVLPAGKYRLKVVARENHSGKLGTFEQPLVLPSEGESKLALSSVVLSNQFEERAGDGGTGARKSKERFRSPLQVGARSILPSVTRVFRTNQILYVYLESYAGTSDLKPDEARAAPEWLQPSAAILFLRGGFKISEAGPFAGKLAKSQKGKAEYLIQIPLEKFPPGRYWMQVIVLDPASDKVVFERVPLVIMKPPTAAASRTGG